MNACGSTNCFCQSVTPKHKKWAWPHWLVFLIRLFVNLELKCQICRLMTPFSGDGSHVVQRSVAARHCGKAWFCVWRRWERTGKGGAWMFLGRSLLKLCSDWLLCLSLINPQRVTGSPDGSCRWVCSDPDQLIDPNKTCLPSKSMRVSRFRCSGTRTRFWWDRMLWSWWD